MRLDLPWWLLSLPMVLGLAWLIARRGGRTVPGRQHRWAVAVRLLALGLLVGAAAQPILYRSVDDRSVMFLLDRSASISADSAAAQEEYLEAALTEARADYRTAVAVFGRDLRLDSAFSDGRIHAPVLTLVDDSSTDIAGALESAAALLPSEGSRRIVLITDLVTTTVDPRPAARRLAEQGIAVDVVELASGRSADALVESVQVPPAARQGDSVPVTAVIRSNVAGPAQVVVRGDGREEITLDVDLVAGRNEIPIEVSGEGSGFLPISVEVRATFDTRPENNRAEAITRLLGPARVAVVEGKSGEAEDLVRGLGAGGLEPELRRSIPTPEELLAYDAVILVNVDRPGNDESEALAAFVEELGRGLVVIGGDQAYGLGDYHLTPLEAVLPVSSNPDDLVRRQPVAEVLVIDSSGSMGACHCNSGDAMEGGVVKTDIAKAGAELAIDALSTSDRVGVLAFAGGADWVIPLGPKPNLDEARSALGAIVANGDTAISRALEEALAELAGAPESLRHIVLFTDGWDPNDANLLPIAREIADAGVTLSVLGTGEGPGTALARMAELGGGRFYPGTDLQSIPEIFVEETLTVARNLATEGTFYPVLAAPSPVTAELTSAPPLAGYVLTKAKGTASVPLEIGQADPLLATWQRGLGRATAWTSDSTARWSTQWVDWAGYVDFWGRLVRDVLPAGRETPPAVYVDGGNLNVDFEVPAADIDATATARVRFPDGEVVVVPMDRVSGDNFSASIPVGPLGAYWVAVTVDNPDGSQIVSGSGAVSSYEEEFAFREPDPGLGPDLSSLTGGQLDPEPGRVFDLAPVIGRADVNIWPWLAAVALGLFLVDVALRRLVLTAGDAEAWKQGVTSRRVKEKQRIERKIEEAAAAGAAPPVLSDSETLERLMRRKRT
ncbi:MAG TPA: VWA domain-containing protein [Acidimicrobiia bacterium]|nr:VWA domain-containing protein [Acidimicrobiia bacterium]